MNKQPALRHMLQANPPQEAILNPTGEELLKSHQDYVRCECFPSLHHVPIDVRDKWPASLAHQVPIYTAG